MGVTVLNMRQVQSQLDDFTHRDLPMAVAKGFGKTAEQGVVSGKRELSTKLHLRSKWILNGVKGTPIKPNQKKAFAHSYSKYGIADGSVYIRGAARPKNDLGFLLNHETGNDRIAKHRFMSIPLRGLRAWKKTDWRTTTGRTKKRLKPSNLMGDNYGKEMGEAKEGSYIAVRLPPKGRKRRKKRRSRYQKPFVMNKKVAGGKRRKGGGGDKILLLYKFKKVTNQSRKMAWEDRVETLVRARLRPNTIRYIQRIMPRSPQ